MRLMREETEYRPKPLVPVGDRPILWHIMKHYAAFGCRRFVLALGFRGELIKEYFLNYHALSRDTVVHLRTGEVTPLQDSGVDEDWEISLVDTGLNSMTGGRVKRLETLLRDEKRFFLTYGDGVGDIDLGALDTLHAGGEYSLVITGVRPPARFGVIDADGDRITHFADKPQTDASYINGGFMVADAGLFPYIAADETILEQEPMHQLARDGRLGVHRHDGFWHPMDTFRDYSALNDMWAEGNAPWKSW